MVRHHHAYNSFTQTYGADVPFKLNEVVEVMGVLSLAPELTTFADAADEDTAADFQEPSRHIPSSMAPR